RLPGLDGDAGIDLTRDGEDPALVGALLAPALAGRGHSLGIRQIAGEPVHLELSATIFPRVGLIGKGLVGGPIAGIGTQRELDEPEPRLAAGTILQLGNLNVFEAEVLDLDRAAGSAGAALGV